MYEIQNIEDKNWFENIFDITGVGGGYLAFSLKPEVLDWSNDNDMIINFIIESRFSKFTKTPELRSLSRITSYLINISYQKIIFKFESEDDYSLFKLTWG